MLILVLCVAVGNGDKRNGGLKKVGISAFGYHYGFSSLNGPNLKSSS